MLTAAMFRKTKIFSFLLLFVVSTTGLPFTINLCKMASSEREQCTMHQEPVSSNCCSEETSDSRPSISFDKSSCCQIEFVYKKVEDQYLLNKTNLDFSDDENILQAVEIVPLLTEISNNVSYFNDSSPPFLIDPDLYITNSILLI